MDRVLYTVVIYVLILLSFMVLKDRSFCFGVNKDVSCVNISLKKEPL